MPLLIIVALTLALDDPAPKFEWTPYVGAAFNSAAGTFLGLAPDRDHFFFGIHANVNLVRKPRWTFGYAPDVVPLLLVTNNTRDISVSDDGMTFIDSNPGTVPGFGISPIGLETHYRVAERWSLFGAGAMGVVWFTRDVPVVYARKFNYTFEYGGGVRWRHTPRTSLRVGYKFHHLSNANSAFRNPGVDAHVFLVGVSLNASPAQERVP